MSKIVLCFPKNGASAANVTVFLPLSVLAIAACVVDEHEVHIFDERVDPIEKYKALLDTKPDIVGISTITGYQIEYGLALATEARKCGATIVWGGVHPSLLPEQTIQHPLVDYVVVGDGEVAFKHLVEQLARAEKPANRIVQLPLPAELETLPDIPYHLVDIERYVTSIKFHGKRALPFLFSRGCPFRCKYCSTGLLTKKWRSLPIDVALERLCHLVERYCLNYVEFFDENITTHSQRFETFARGIPKGVNWMIQSRLNAVLKLDLPLLKQCGMDIISSGLESGSNRILEAVGKGETVEEYLEANRMLAAVGITSNYNMMMGFPEETLEDLHASIDLTLQVLNENPYANFSPFYVFQPYPMTPLAIQYKVKGYETLEEWADFNRHNMRTPFAADRVDLLENITFSSKYVGRLFREMFPGDQAILSLEEELRHKWQIKDFLSADWKPLRQKHQEIITAKFGKDAY